MYLQMKKSWLWLWYFYRLFLEHNFGRDFKIAFLAVISKTTVFFYFLVLIPKMNHFQATYFYRLFLEHKLGRNFQTCVIGCDFQNYLLYFLVVIPKMNQLQRVESRPASVRVHCAYCLCMAFDLTVFILCI